MKKYFYLIGFLVLILLSSCGKKEYVPPAASDLSSQPVVNIVKQMQTAPTAYTSDVKLYRGTWFDIEYPSTFIANPPESTAPSTPIQGVTAVRTDEAVFTSPDNEVEFFVFSPLWAGNPQNYLQLAANEQLIDEKTDESGTVEEGNKRIVRWGTIKGPNGSYYRSYISISNQVGTGNDTHHVFGIKYVNNDAYEKYRDAYIAFKKSLKQYSD